MDSNVNITTIAKLAKTSTASVSNYINGTENFPLSKEKRERIKAAMRQTNYRPSIASSKLRRKGVIASKAVFIFGTYPSCNQYITYRNPMLTELLFFLCESIRREFNLALEVRAVEDETSLESWNDTIADADAILCYGRVDGMLLDLCIRRNIPLVVISETNGMVSSIQDKDAGLQDVVYWDPGTHLSMMLEHVIGKGAKNIGFVTSSNIKANRQEYYALEAEKKIEEFEHHLSAAKNVNGRVLETPSPDAVIHIDYEARNTFEFARNVDLRSFDAIVAHNDMVALGVAWALHGQGLQVGRDVMLGGEGDYTCCRYAIPAISTVSYDKRKMVEEVCRILKRRLELNLPLGELIPIPSMLMERESTRLALTSMEVRRGN